ncbi:MAG: EamA family transporter [Desulfovibrionaceae bacterium]|nr:EamA family transporter [Desulfovibrionaceae bacterium]MBF0513466.1 EamA family transporter [Desulfovibrionaceae bacterium]
MIYLKLTLTALLWGGTFIAGRILAKDTPPFTAAFGRFGFALLALAPILARRRDLCPKDAASFALAALLGATGVFGYNAFFFWGLKTVDAGRAALIVACNPVAITVFSAMIFGERLRPAALAGVAACLAGAAVVVSRGDVRALLAGAIGPGEAAIFGCVACWTSYTLIGKRAMESMSPLAAVTLGCAFGAAFLLPPALGEGMPGLLPGFAARQWLALAYLGACGTTLGFIWYYQGIAAIGPARSGVFLNLVPVSAVFMGGLILGEKTDPSLLAGAALVLGGVWLTNRYRVGK